MHRLVLALCVSLLVGCQGIPPNQTFPARTTPPSLAVVAIQLTARPAGLRIGGGPVEITIFCARAAPVKPAETGAVHTVA